MVVLTVYFFMRYRSIMPVDVIRQERNINYPKDWQKPGIVVLGIGIGIVVAGVLKSVPVVHMHGAASLGIIVVCAGVSMIIAQALDKKKSNED